MGADRLIERRHLRKEEKLKQETDAPFQMASLPKLFTVSEVYAMIKNNLYPNNAPGYDLITEKLIIL